MYVKNKWMRGKRGWGCDLCSCELTLTNLQSGRHTRSTRNGYRIPSCQVDFSGPSFDQGREIPAAPGGVNRVLFPNGWQWHREGAFPPGWDDVPLGWPAQEAPEDFQPLAHNTPSESDMLPPSATGHIGRAPPPLLPAVPNLVAPGSFTPGEAADPIGRGTNPRDPTQRSALEDPWTGRAAAPRPRSTGSSSGQQQREGPRLGWADYAPGGAALLGAERGPRRDGEQQQEPRPSAHSQPAQGPRPGQAQTIAVTQARHFQDYGELQWQDPTKRPIGTLSLGPLPGAEVLQEDWEGYASRFVQSLVHNASMENNSVFGAEWTEKTRDLLQLQNSGVTALGVTFYEAKYSQQLDAFRTKIPETRDQIFEELLRQGLSDGQEVICATWWPGYTLRHGESEIEQCEYWISSRHPGIDHFASGWPSWPPRTKEVNA